MALPPVEGARDARRRRKAAYPRGKHEQVHRFKLQTVQVFVFLKGVAVAIWFRSWSWRPQLTSNSTAQRFEAMPTQEVEEKPPFELETVPGSLIVSDAAGTLDFRRIESLASPDFPALEQLILSNADYRWAIQRRLPRLEDAREVVTGLPKGALRAQKYVWGVWESETLVGCLDVIRAWPQPDHLCIGLLLLDESVRRRGLGHRALRLLAARTKAWSKVRRWQISVVETHQSALKFWLHEGFRPTGEKVDLGMSAPLLVLERKLPH